MDDAGDGIDRSFAGNHPKVTAAADAPRHFVATFGAQGQFFTISTGKQAMSVAFRREGDDEHKEPEFELPIAVGPNWVTPRGLRLLGEAVAQIEAEIAATVDAEARKKLQRPYAISTPVNRPPTSRRRPRTAASASAAASPIAWARPKRRSPSLAATRPTRRWAASPFPPRSPAR